MKLYNQVSNARIKRQVQFLTSYEYCVNAWFRYTIVEFIGNEPSSQGWLTIRVRTVSYLFVNAIRSYSTETQAWSLAWLRNVKLTLYLLAEVKSLKHKDRVFQVLERLFQSIP